VESLAVLFYFVVFLPPFSIGIQCKPTQLMHYITTLLVNIDYIAIELYNPYNFLMLNNVGMISQWFIRLSIYKLPPPPASVQFHIGAMIVFGTQFQYIQLINGRILSRVAAGHITGVLIVFWYYTYCLSSRKQIIMETTLTKNNALHQRMKQNAHGTSNNHQVP
jgi:hypothetical protein